MAMMYINMDPLCILHGHCFYLIYITWIHYVLFVAMEYSYILHIPWICSVLALVTMLASLLRMGMPDLGRENSSLIFVDGYFFWINYLGTFMGTSIHPHLSKLIIYFIYHFFLMNSHIRGHFL
jgi:hypothetical protein